MEALDTLYSGYLREAIRASAAVPFLKRVLGGGMTDHPCHVQFLEGLKQLLAETEPEQLPEALKTVYQAPILHRDCEDSAYWSLLAAHALTLDKIPLLSPAVAGELMDWYQGAYPKRERLPAQDQVLKALKARSAQ